jgi:hypothetical protein
MATELAYHPEVECEATPSDLYETEVVGVLDETENRHYLRVAQGSVRHLNGKTYLPVTIIDFNQRARRVLIQLPYEADSGASRLWVRLDQFRTSEVDAGEYVT